MQQITKRQIQILLQLLENSEPTTTKELAEQQNVSVRTIKYDLDTIRLWLHERNQDLASKRSQGVWLVLSDSERIKLKSELMEVERLELFADQTLRLDRLSIQLMLTNQAITSFELADRLMVSKDTILHDLDALEQQLIAQGMTLERLPRKGFLITGPERQIRLLIEQVVQKDLTDYDIYKIMDLLLQSEKREGYELYAAKGTAFQVVLNEVLADMRQLLKQIDTSDLNYAELLNMVIRVAIATVRLKNEYTIGRYQLLNDPKEQQELSYLLMQEVFDHYQLPLFEDEYRYIYSDTFENSPAQDVMLLTENLIQKVSKKVNHAFYNDPQLLTNLYAHLSMRLSRKQKFVNEYNPFKDDIKAKYPRLFEAIEAVVLKEIQGERLLINDSFIAYIALHFLVSYEKEADLRSVRVVYVCSTGLGVTSLIKQKISEELTNIEIAAFASVLNAQEVIKQKEPDLVISIFPIEGMDCEFIKVHPLPTKQDLDKIRQTVKKILSQSPQNGRRKLRLESAGNRASLEDFSKELILQAYTIYEKLLVLFQEKLSQEYREAFLLHVFLMVHRIIFDQQYVMEGTKTDEAQLASESISKEIEQLFAEHNLTINQSEINALFAYIKG
ncbi:transcription antiterminator [Enterococcus dongliensis]|uniref:Transcription antiterminator n=1 Tax=Enterococcus dongliensis TaxID=2559925 RepID=A0AAP5NN12_9ENTE|nr:transcription antiterminator [Enterococcus dongliensis]MDT2597925.1 transcription antiterminator [Enterococcus dongliensis]MDT2604891.1 transcription antiterminator [Enterococcus dongliensis]MDT2612657.1 transcription antiterminator [Enterococcus dongliensis]MDT2635837.1 transcription antiterminator [Enterococcus dongliensis]MDT2638380.1 transcription antiterminator [Enterococcus dongliensis]